MARVMPAFGLSVMAFVLNGCFGCPNESAYEDTLIVAGSIAGFDDTYRPCGGSDGECWAIGEAIVTYTDGTVMTWTDTIGGRSEFYIRSSSFGSTGRFDWSLLDVTGDAFAEDKEVESVRYLIELVDHHSDGGLTFNTRTGICFEGVVQSERFLTPEEDPFTSDQEREACDLSERDTLRVEAEFSPSGSCPS